MPRQRNRYSRRTYVLPEDFPQRLKLFQEESGLPWSEIARRLVTYRHTVWRWAEGRTGPNYQHRKALVELADSLIRYTTALPGMTTISFTKLSMKALRSVNSLSFRNTLRSWA